MVDSPVILCVAESNIEFATTLKSVDVIEDSVAKKIYDYFHE